MKSHLQGLHEEKLLAANMELIFEMTVYTNTSLQKADFTFLGSDRTIISKSKKRKKATRSLGLEVNRQVKRTI